MDGLGVGVKKLVNSGGWALQPLVGGDGLVVVSFLQRVFPPHIPGNNPLEKLPARDGESLNELHVFPGLLLMLWSCCVASSNRSSEQFSDVRLWTGRTSLKSMLNTWKGGLSHVVEI